MIVTLTVGVSPVVSKQGYSQPFFVFFYLVGLVRPLLTLLFFIFLAFSDKVELFFGKPAF